LDRALFSALAVDTGVLPVVEQLAVETGGVDEAVGPAELELDGAGVAAAAGVVSLV
jgi:hypothetical protein